MTSTPDDPISQHQQALLAAFAAVLSAEEAVRDARAREAEAISLLTGARNVSETRLERAWAEVEKLMGGTGETEVLLPGTATDYKIARPAPRETVKVEPDAVPDEFCRTERKPRLKEIGEFLNGLRDQGLDFPNWASFQLSTPKLGWKAVKKSSVTT